MDREACILFSCNWFLTLHPAFPSLADMSQSLTVQTGPIFLPISSCLSGKPWRMPPLKDLPAHTLFFQYSWVTFSKPGRVLHTEAKSISK